jgi:hypothetical protein
MKKILAIAVLPMILMFTISSCSKTGATGPAGPLSTGTLTGYVTIYDQYGFKVPGDLSGVSVLIPGMSGDSVTTTSTGQYTINNLKTGVYNLVYSQAGSGTVLANNYSFLGGGTIYRNQTMSLIPSFSLFSPYINDTVVATDSGVVIRGIDSVNGVARQYIIFGSSASTVSSAPGSYVYNSAVQTIKAGAAAFGVFLTSQELNDAGLAPGTTGYFIAYPYSTGQPTYVDLSTGKTVYTALGTPTAVFSVMIP